MKSKSLLVSFLCCILCFSCELLSPPAFLEVSSNIDNALIYINGELITAKTDSASAIIIEIESGEYEIMAFSSGYDFPIITGTADRDATIPVDLNFSAQTPYYDVDYEDYTLGNYNDGFDSEVWEILAAGTNQYLRKSSADDTADHMALNWIYSGSLTNFIWEIDTIGHNAPDMDIRAGYYTFGESTSHFCYETPDGSWITIEHDGDIPEISRDQIMNHRLVVKNDIIRYFVDDILVLQYEDDNNVYNGTNLIGFTCTLNAPYQEYQSFYIDMDNIRIYPTE